jgi:cytochrome c
LRNTNSIAREIYMNTRKTLLAALIFAAIHTPAFAGNGDATKGAILYQGRCGGCHSLDENRIGPAHRGVVGRKAGSMNDFKYSAALQKSKVIWSEKTLDQWLANPERVIPGQQMFFAVAEAKDRADIIAYLKSVPAKR